MATVTFEFGSFEYIDERILVIVIDEGVVIDGELSCQLVAKIEETLTQPSILIIDRRHDYSYSGTGMMTLKGSNIAKVKATAIVSYSVMPERAPGKSVNVMNTTGRSQLNVFPSLELALNWADELLAQHQ